MTQDYIHMVYFERALRKLESVIKFGVDISPFDIAEHKFLLGEYYKKVNKTACKDGWCYAFESRSSKMNNIKSDTANYPKKYILELNKNKGYSNQEIADMFCVNIHRINSMFKTEKIVYPWKEMNCGDVIFINLNKVTPEKRIKLIHKSAKAFAKRHQIPLNIKTEVTNKGIKVLKTN